eukprot:TRINITY_DN4998_c0_g1_i1.p1 TRINITY_DN4998_c0_g1~~TRINITY_DN4998_c0_g1_i1.p1  ORF type:complete len:389 (+),score=58.82 TRINITY_DN4998_c0_g1_i1:59-1225(+)
MSVTVWAKVPGVDLQHIELKGNDGVTEVYGKVAEACGLEVGTFEVVHDGEALDVGVLVQDDVLDVKVEGKVAAKRLLEADGWRVDRKGFDGVLANPSNVPEGVIAGYLAAGILPNNGTIHGLLRANDVATLSLLLPHTSLPQYTEYIFATRPLLVFTKLLKFLPPDGLTALLQYFCAATYPSDSLEKLRALINHGVSVTAPNSSGDTPAHILTRRGQMTAAPRLQLFLQNGASLSAKNNDGETVEDIIFRRGKSALARVALKYGADRSRYISRIEARTGLILPVHRVRRAAMKKANRKMNRVPAILLTGVVEYVTTELLTLATAIANKNKKRRMLTPRHINTAIRTDSDFSSLCANVSIASGGVPEHVHAAIRRKKRQRGAVPLLLSH